LAEFISALRAELAVAQQRAADDKDNPLKLRVGPIELELEIAYTVEKSGELHGGVRAKFWVLEFGEAGGKASLSAERARTQRLKLTLTPGMESTEINAQGEPQKVVLELDVSGTKAGLAPQRASGGTPDPEDQPVEPT
jgi:hypothetical protein